MTIHITSKARKQEEAEIEALYPYRQPPYPADPDRLPGHKIVNGVAIQDSRNTEPEWTPNITIERQSHCRGEFARVEMTARPLSIPIEGRKMIDALIALVKCWQRGDKVKPAAMKRIREKADKAIDTYYAWAYKEALAQSGAEKDEPVSADIGEVSSPLSSGGQDAAPEQRVCEGVAGSTWVPEGSHRVAGISGLSDPKADRPPANRNGCKLGKSSLKVIHTSLAEHPPINPRAILDHVQSIFYESSTMVTRHKRLAGLYFVISEGSGASVIMYHNLRPDVYEVIGTWTLTDGGRHRWALVKNYQARLDELYRRLELPTVKEIVKPLPV